MLGAVGMGGVRRIGWFGDAVASLGVLHEMWWCFRMNVCRLTWWLPLAWREDASRRRKQLE